MCGGHGSGDTPRASAHFEEGQLIEHLPLLIQTQTYSIEEELQIRKKK